MALALESRVYAPVSVSKTFPVRPQRHVGDVSDSPQRAAQSFVESLPPDVRDKIGSLNRDADRRNGFDRTKRDVDETASRESSSETTQARPYEAVAQQQDPIYTAPILTPGATLLQAQLSTANGFEKLSRDVTSFKREAVNDAYVSAGAQPGGRAAALAAQIAQQEQANQVFIVPPVLTSVNFTA